MASFPAFTVPRPLMAALERGAVRLPLDGLGEAQGGAGVGRPLELVDPTGTFLAWTLSDSENGFLYVLSRSPEDLPTDALLRRRVLEAFELRAVLRLIPPDGRVGGSFRLVNADGDGFGGIVVDVYGDYAIQYVLAKGLRDWGRRVAAATADVAAERGLQTASGDPWPKGILQKVRTKGAARPGKPVQSIVYGDEVPEKFVVEESGALFEIHPLAGLNVGLFTDMREHRSRLDRFASGARVLNTFAYTGSLSVAAVRAGARHVTSVDLSSGVLKWARSNFRLAGLDPDAHRFEVSDTMRFLSDAEKRGEEYDFVILDPPTYSAARAAAWSMKRDLRELITRAALLVSAGGILWFSGNSHQLTDQELESRIAEGARNAERELTLLESGGLPPDFPTPVTLPEARYLKLRVFRVR